MLSGCLMLALIYSNGSTASTREPRRSRILRTLWGCMKFDRWRCWSRLIDLNLIHLLLLNAPRALESSHLGVGDGVKSLLWLGGLSSIFIFIIFINALELLLFTLPLSLCILLRSKHLTTLHVVDQVLLDWSSSGCCRLWSLIRLYLFLLSSCRNCVCSGLVLEDPSNRNSLSLISQGEATKLGHSIMLLERNGNAGLNAANDSIEALCILRHLLFNNFTLLILLVRDKDLLNGCFIRDSMNMENALVALRHDGLVVDQLKDFDFCLKELWDRNDLGITKADDITLVDSILALNIESELNILTRLGIAHALLLSIVYGLYLARDTTGHQSQAITKSDGTWLDFTEGNSSSFLHLVKHGDS